MKPILHNYSIKYHPLKKKHTKGKPRSNQSTNTDSLSLPSSTA